MNDNQFWSIIESAWEAIGGYSEARTALLEGRDSEDYATSLFDPLEQFIGHLQSQLEALSEAELSGFDRVLERKMYEIDRSDIHERTDGSDDGFLYCRGFIVAIGKSYYEAVKENPDLAVVDAECPSLGYISWHLYHSRFRKHLESDISRETGSNIAGWEDEDD